MRTKYHRPYADAEQVTKPTPRISQGQNTEDVPLSEPIEQASSRRSFVKTMLLGGSAALALFICGPSVVRSLSDQWQYGDARISEFFYDVGHSGMSRFLASYFKSSVSIVEYSHNADPDHEQTYTIPVPGNDQFQHVVTLEKRLMHGRQNLIVQIEGISITFILYNTGAAFQTTPNEEEVRS